MRGEQAGVAETGLWQDMKEAVIDLTVMSKRTECGRHLWQHRSTGMCLKK